MFVVKFVLMTVLLVCVSARHTQLVDNPYDIYRQTHNVVETNQEPQYYEPEEFQHPGHLTSARVRRQAQGRLSLNSDGSTGIDAKIPLVNNDKNQLSAIGKMAFDDKMNTATKGIGLAFDNINGHGVSVTKDSIPGFGSTLTGAGYTTLYKNDNHNVGANAFLTRNMPTYNPSVPNYNTIGGGLDYTYKNKIGGSLGMSHTPFLQRKEYSAMGNLNLYRSPTSSVDFSAGFRRMDSPMMNTGWKPNFGLVFNRSF